MRILECPPSDKPGYIDEADQFYMHHSSWLLEHFGNSSGHKEEVHLPTHIVLYNVLLPVSLSFLISLSSWFLQLHAFIWVVLWSSLCSKRLTSQKNSLLFVYLCILYILDRGSWFCNANSQNSTVASPGQFKGISQRMPKILKLQKISIGKCHVT